MLLPKRKFSLAILFTSFVAISFAQSSVKTDTAEHHNFLWFTGHWNSKNVFVTAPYTDSNEIGVFKLSGGNSITVSNNGQVNLSSSEVDSWNKKIENGLSALDNFEQQLYAPANVVNEWGHHFEEVTKPELDDLKQNWRAEKIDSKTDMLDPANQKEQATPLQQFASHLNSWCNENRSKYDAIISFYKAHKKDKDADLVNPPPPESEYECVACDTTIAKRNAQKDSAYASIFFKPESDLMRDALGIERDLMLLGIGTDFTGTSSNVSMDQDMAEQIYQAFSKKQNGSCSYIDNSELNNAIWFLGQRMFARAKKLFKDYEKNIKTAPAVIATMLSATRTAMLMAMKVDDDDVMAECGALVARVLEYYSNKLFHEHDWSQLANIPFILGLERQHQLMGGHESDLIQNLEKLLNGFHLQIEMDAKVGKANKEYSLAHLKSKDVKIAPEFNYENDSCYRWVIVDGVNKIGFPLKKSSQQIECDLLANEIVGPGPRPIYIGTKKYFTMMYGLKMDYCHPGQDSIFLSSFIPVPNAFAGKWQMPGGTIMPLQIDGTDGIFRNINKMEEMVKSGAAERQAEIMKQKGQQIADQMKALQKQMGNGKGATNMAAIQKMQDLATQGMSLGTDESLAPVLYIDFPLEIKNKTTTLHDKRFDAKEINPIEAEVIVYGYYTVKVIYDPAK